MHTLPHRTGNWSLPKGSLELITIVLHLSHFRPFCQLLKTSMSSGIPATLPDQYWPETQHMHILLPSSRLIKMLNTLGSRAQLLEKV